MSGYGRVPISPDGEVMKVRKIRTTDAEWEKCLKLSNGAGRSAFLRHAINTTELPKRAMTALYLISQTTNQHPDAFKHAVVVAGSEDAAHYMHPYLVGTTAKSWSAQDWCLPEQVRVYQIGTAARGLAVGTVVCATTKA